LTCQSFPFPFSGINKEAAKLALFLRGKNGMQREGPVSDAQKNSRADFCEPSNEPALKLIRKTVFEKRTLKVQEKD